MNSLHEAGEIIPEKRGGWLSAVTLALFAISTTAFDVRIMVRQDVLRQMLFLPCLIFIQSYIIWYYFYRFRPIRKTLAICDSEMVRSYSRLFVLATVGTSVVALVGLYLFR
jgi:uncharacterized membrane protein